MSGHLSRLALDLVCAGAAGAEERLHLDGCERCAAQLASMRQEYGAFLARFPSLDELARSRPATPERRWWRAAAPWRLGLAGAVAAAALVAFALSYRQHPPPDGGVRAKGSSIVELAVARGGRSFVYEEGLPLRQGDILAFRYTTARPYLLLLSLERSGKVNVYFTDPSRRRSMRIQPGQGVQLKVGVELDDYLGPERVIALLSQSPLEVEAVRRAVLERFGSLGGADRDRLELGPLQLDAEQFGWLLEKGRAER
jgi:hypothetical protein